MTRNRSFFRQPRMTVAHQAAAMRRVWPDFDTQVKRSALTSTGVIQPSAITRAYRVQIGYQQGGVPRAYVLSPKLMRRESAPDIAIPHTYNFTTPGQERPCLYYPRNREWTADMPVATSIMPWLLSWLVDYEYWLATGEWLGGGVAHGDTKTQTHAPAA